LSIKEINAECNYLYFNYILTIQVFKSNGTDFAEDKKQDQTTCLNGSIFESLKSSGDRSPRESSAIATRKLKMKSLRGKPRSIISFESNSFLSQQAAGHWAREDERKTVAHGYENQPDIG
jgi:hypothetical protein